MTCAEFHELAAGYALGALDPEEQRLCELHLAASEHDGCQEKLAEARRTVAALGDSIAPVRPREAIWKQIESGLAPAERPAAGGRGARVTAWVLALAAAGALAWGIREWRKGADLRDRMAVLEGDSSLAVQQRRRLTAERSACLKDLQAARADLALRDEAVALLGVPETRVIAFAPQGDAKSGGRAVVNFGEKKGVVIARGLTPQDGKDYELWILRGNDPPRPAGVFHGDPDTTLFRIEPALLADGADALAITLEPAGGSPAPTAAPFLIGPIPKG
jgi:anti-sigma-K factor RskA